MHDPVGSGASAPAFGIPGTDALDQHFLNGADLFLERTRHPALEIFQQKPVALLLDLLRYGIVYAQRAPW